MVAVEELYTPEAMQNPYPVLERLRAEAPVARGVNPPRWVLTRFADVDAALRDQSWIVGGQRIANLIRIRPPEVRAELQPLFDAIANQMLFSDPPDHTRLRGLVSKAFTPRVVQRLRPRIEQIVDDLLDPAVERGSLDVVHDFAYPLPAIVITEMLGIPPAERDQFKAWSDDFATFLGNTHGKPEIDRRAHRSIDEAGTYFQSVARQLREHPADDLLSLMVTAEEQGDRLSGDELLANAFLLLAAGHETTTNLIANGLLALLQNPDQLRRLRDDPALIATAVEEFLRYESPVKLIVRAAPSDLEVDGHQIAKGEVVLFHLAAANRDPEQFSEPNQLDVGRKPNPHLAFGLGIHFCLGAPLARLEGQIAIGRVLERFPNVRLTAETVEWQPNPTFRALKALPVAG
jgi:cytochrome P450